MALRVAEDLAEDVRHPRALVPAFVLFKLAQGPRHGYALSSWLADLGVGPGTGTGTLYRDLRRLEEAGLAYSYWEASQTRGPARRVYEITDAGLVALDECEAALDELARTLRRIRRRPHRGRRRI